MRIRVVDKHGREVKVNSQGVPKKNFHAIKCLIAFAVILLVLTGLIVGGVFIAGNMAIKELTNGRYSFNDVRKTLSNIGDYRTVEKKELDNTYTADDVDTFTAALADTLFLRELSTADVNEIMDAYADTIARNMTDGKNQSDDNFLNEKLENLFNKLFTESNIKKEKISNYSNDKIKQYSINLSDRSAAAFLNETVLGTIFDNQNFKNAMAANMTKSVADSLGEISGSVNANKIIDLAGFDYRNLLQIRQITFYSTGEGKDAKAGIKFITQTNIKAIINAMFKEIKGENFLSEDANALSKIGFNSLVFCVKSLIKGILPAKLYVSVDIPVSGDEKPQISLNGTTRQDYDNLMGLLSALSGEDFKDPLESIFGEGSAVDNAVKSTNDMFPIKDTIVMSGKSGTIELDAINLILELSGVNSITDESGNKRRKTEEEGGITSKDVYLLLKTVSGADTNAAMQNKPDYKENTPLTAGYENGVFTYIKGDSGRTLTQINDEYQEALLYAFKDSYGLNASSFDQLFEVISGGNPDQLLSLFDAGKIKDIVNGQASGITLDAQMLSALIAAQSKKFLGEGGGSFDMTTVTPRYVMLYTQESGGITHNMMEVGVEITLQNLVKKMLPDGDDLVSVILNRLMTALVSESILIRAEIDITAGGENFKYLPSRFALDRLEYAEAERLNALLGSLAGEDGNFTDFLADMLLPVRDMIGTMTKTLPGLTIGESAIVMPDLYSLLASVLQDKLTPEEVENVLQGVYFDKDGNAWLEFNGDESADTDAFISEKLSVLEPPFQLNLRPSFNDTELAAMINSKLQLDKGFRGELGSVLLLAQYDDSAEAKSVRQWLTGFDGQDYGAADYMIITAKLNFENLGYAGNFNSFMPDDFYVTLLYQMDGITPTFKWYRFNDMSIATQNSLYSLLNMDELDKVLGEGEGNVGGGYFKTLADTILGIIDSAIWSKLEQGLATGSLGVSVTYYYRASQTDGALGELVVIIEINPWG